MLHRWPNPVGSGYTGEQGLWLAFAPPPWSAWPKFARRARRRPAAGSPTRRSGSPSHLMAFRHACCSLRTLATSHMSNSLVRRTSALLAGFILCSSLGLARNPVNEDGNIIDFERDVVPILRARCLECHNKDEAKNDFRVDDRETFMAYLEPGDPESSPLYFDYLISEYEDMVMPPVAHGGPLSPSELSIFNVWISEGADWPEGVEIALPEKLDPKEVVAVETPEAEPMSLPARMWAFQGYFHPATVHFPIALLLMGAGFVVLGWFIPAMGRDVPFVCLVIGSVFAIFSCMMGWSLAIEQGWGGISKGPDTEIFWHRWSGVTVAVLGTVLSVIAILDKRNPRRRLQKFWTFGLLILAAMVGLVGHQGGELTYGHDFYDRAFNRLSGFVERVEEKTDGKPPAAAVGESEDA